MGVLWCAVCNRPRPAGLHLLTLELPALDEVDAPECRSKGHKENSAARITAKKQPDDFVVLDLEQARQETIKRRHPQKLCMRRQWAGTRAAIKIEDPEEYRHRDEHRPANTGSVG